MTNAFVVLAVFAVLAVSAVCKYTLIYLDSISLTLYLYLYYLFGLKYVVSLGFSFPRLG